MFLFKDAIDWLIIKIAGRYVFCPACGREVTNQAVCDYCRIQLPRLREKE